MNANTFYVPLLRTKRGEFLAVKDLSDQARNRFMPFFDCHRRSPLEIEKGVTFDGHIHKILTNIDKYWPKGQSFFFDIFSISPSNRMKDGRHPLTHCFDHFRNAGYKATLVTGIDRTSDYTKEVKQCLDLTRDGELCLRVSRDDIATPNLTIPMLQNLLAELEITFNQVHLLLDFRFISSNEIDDLIDQVAAFTSSSSITAWKSFIVAATSFPIDMSGIIIDDVTRIERSESKFWQALIAAEPLIGRRPVYADYGIVNPEKPEVDVRTMRGSCKIRYATASEWIVVKGHSDRKTPGRVQYPTLTTKLIQERGYLGKDYSWGDKFIHDCATNSGRTGNGETWVRVDTNHHLTLVGEVISSLVSS